MKCVKWCVIGVLAILASTVSVFGQTQPNLDNGYKPYGSYDGSNIDTINLQNGNLMLHIPLPFSYPQRGGRLTSTNVLSVSSKAWNVQTDVGSSHFWSPGGFGPMVNIGQIGTGVGFANTMDLAVHRTLTIESDGFSTSTSAFGYYLTMWDASTHQLVEQPNGPVDENSNAYFFDADDASGYRVELNPACDAANLGGCGAVIDRAGNRYEFDKFVTRCSKSTTNNSMPGSTTTQVCQQTALPVRIIDANGNLITTKDTLGRLRNGMTFLVSGDTSGCVQQDPNTPIATATTYTYQGYNGITNQIKVCTSNIPIQTFFGLSGVSEYQNSSEGINNPTLPAIVTVLILDGDSWVDSSRWTFSYDSYLNVTSLGLPTGGSINYGWSTLYGGAGCNGNTPATRVVSTRTINDNNGNSFRWTYGYVAPSPGGVFGNTVTDPLNNDTLHYFYSQDKGCTFLEQTTQYFQGAAGSGKVPVKQIDTLYTQGTVPNMPPGVVYNAWLPTSIKTTLLSGKVSLVTKTYDQGPGGGRPVFGNVLSEKQYDWGGGAAGPLMREIDTAYEWQVDTTGAYQIAHLIDLVASTVVKDPNNCVVSESDNAYDEGGEAALQSSGIGTSQQHLAPHTPGVRGNATSVTKWLITGGSTGTCGSKTSSISSKTTWYDTGLVYKSFDPLGNATTHFYDPAYAGAYPTQTTDALNHSVSGTYDYTTGLLTSFTNQNGSSMASGNTPGDSSHTMNYGYDAMSRIRLATFPDGGQVSFNYSPANTFPLNVEKVKKINATLSDDAFVYLDGLGRPVKAVHKTPQGDVIVNTAYDALDHTISLTNPYISTSDPTYGVVQTQYDAIGRTTQVTKQDGSVSTVLYSQNGSVSAGDCTITKDEAGKQRRTCTDALGRMVEVDEPGDFFPGTKANGSLTIGGSLGSTTIPGTNSTTSTATITINGTEHIKSVTTTTRCTATQIKFGCQPTTTTTTTYDSGTVSIAINGTSYVSRFDGNTNTNVSASAIASDLVGQINNPGAPNPYVSASITNTSSTSASILLTARAAGSAGNSISFATSTTWDTTDFPSGSSFVPAPASGTLTGGTNGTAPTTITDSGTIKAIITNHAGSTVFTTAAVSYGGTSGNNAANQVASALNSALNASGSPVSASVNGATISLTYTTVGVAGDVTVSLSSSSNQSAYFPNGSFSGSGSLNNGADAEGPSLDHPYVTQYGYDTLGNMVCAVQKGMDISPFTTCAAAPAAWRPRSFTYDSLSRLLTATNPESGTITYSYDADGNVLQKTSPAANQTGTATTTISVCYDALNRSTGKAYSAQPCQNGQLPAGAAAITLTYDTGANGLGLLTGVTDQAGSASYSYEALGRLKSESRTINGVTKPVSYDYYLDGSLNVIHYPSGAAVTYTPDSVGRIISAVDLGNNINYVTGATYNPSNAPTGFLNGQSSSFTGIINAFSYNSQLQPINISATTPSQQTVFSIGYDFHVGNGTSGTDNGNVWGITNFKDSNRSESFTYDPLNRLASAQTAGTDCSALLADGHTKNWGDSYSYDAWGNLLGKTPTKCGGENITLTMNTKNQASSVRVGGGNPVTYTFDAAGNLKNDGSVTYNYDAENRLTGANGYTYTYDADSNRVKKSNGTSGTIYWYSAVGVIAETDLSGSNQREYVFFNGARVARKDANGQVFYYFSDRLQTTSVITDSIGNIKSESDFDPWGVERRVVDSFNNTYKFTGKERDAETGLDYFGARYYSSFLGRFVTPDWAAKAVAVPYAHYGNPQSLNLYSYVTNNPTTMGDPDGHDGDVVPEASGMPQPMQECNGNASCTAQVTSSIEEREGGDGSMALTLHQSVTTTTQNPDGTVTTASAQVDTLVNIPSTAQAMDGQTAVQTVTVSNARDETVVPNGYRDPETGELSNSVVESHNYDQTTRVTRGDLTQAYNNFGSASNVSDGRDRVNYGYQIVSSIVTLRNNIAVDSKLFNLDRRVAGLEIEGKVHAMIALMHVIPVE